MNKYPFLKQNIHYTLLQGFYWLSYAFIWASRSAVLLNKGFDSTQIGLISAAALFSASVFFQPYMSSLVDRYTKFSSRKFSLGICITATVIVILLSMADKSKIITAVLYAMIGICLLSIIPFINSISMELRFEGIEINYSLSRGIGSAFYSTGAMLAGTLLEKYSSVVLFPIAIGIFITYAVIIYLFRYSKKDQKRTATDDIDTVTDASSAPDGAQDPAHEDTADTNADALSIPAFLKKYPNYTLTMIGYGFILATHCCIAAYTVQITNKIGGAETAMGIALALGSAVEVPAMLLLPYLVKRFSLKNMFRLSAFMFIVKNFLLLIANTMPLIYLACGLQFFTCGIGIPCSVYYVGQVVDAANQVKGQSLMHLFSNALMASVYMIVGGTMIDRIGISAMLAMMTISGVIGTVILFISTSRLDENMTANP